MYPSLPRWGRLGTAGASPRPAAVPIFKNLPKGKNTDVAIRQPSDDIGRAPAEMPRLVEPDRNRQRRDDAKRALSGVAVHAAVDVRRNDKRAARIDSADRVGGDAAHLTVKARAEDAIDDKIVPTKVAARLPKRNRHAARAGARKVIRAVGRKLFFQYYNARIHARVGKQRREDIAVPGVIAAAADHGNAPVPCAGVENALPGARHQRPCIRKMRDRVRIAPPHIGDRQHCRHRRARIFFRHCSFPLSCGVHYSRFCAICKDDSQFAGKEVLYCKIIDKNGIYMKKALDKMNF